MRGLIVGFMLGVCTLPGACLSPTQVNVTVTTDLQCAASSDPKSTTPVLEKTDILVKKDGVWERVGGTAACANGRVGNIVFVPGKSPDVVLRVKGTVRGHPDLDADRVLKFLPHQPLDLTVALSSACVGVMCPGSQTCVEGMCVEPPSSIPDGGMPLDSSIPLFDAAMDQRADAIIVDAPFDTNNMLDAGSCPLALKTPDAWWSFDEGMSPIAELVSQTKTTISVPLLFVPGPCKSALRAPKPSTPVALFGVGSWMPSKLKIAFYILVHSGSGPFLQRAPQLSGGFMLSWANNQLNFMVMNSASAGTTLTGGAWHAVVVTYDAGSFTLTIDGNTTIVGGTAVSPKPPGTNELLFGSPTIDVTLDELYLAQ